MSNQSVIDALRAALQASPGDTAIAVHLAELLLERGEPGEAGPLFQRALDTDPSDVRALRGAAAAARAAGDDRRAEGLERLVAALDPGDPPPAPAPAPDSAGTVTPFPHDRGASPATDESRLRVVEPETSNVTTGPWEDFEPPITLDDVGGLETVKKRLRTTFLAPLRNPELASMYRKSLSGGLLLYGPPGCGKTYIARALAGELGARFLSIGLSDVLDMWLGESERKLHELFETARRAAPAVLFFDEIDALGQKRSQLRHSGGRNIVNQLLAELDGVDTENRDVFVLAATNHPWDVDTALRRPGRFDRMMLVLPPDTEAREAILAHHLRERPTADLDLAQAARSTALFSGADLAHLCDSAVELALEKSLESGTASPVTSHELAQALSDLRPSTTAWFDMARNYAMFANERGSYDELLEYIRANKL